MKKKKMNWGEAKQMLREFKTLPPEEQKFFAKLNNVSVSDVESRLQTYCYYICRLSSAQKKTFRNEIERMSREEIEAVERVNNNSIDKIIESLDMEIAYYDNYMKKKRAFNKAWEVRGQEVINQLIEEGKIQVHEGYMTTDIFLIKALADAQQELRKEFGL